MQMYENANEEIKAVLVSVDTGEFDVQQSLDELEELAQTAQVSTLAKVTQKRESVDTATCIGSGRLEEVAGFCETNGVGLIIFDHELTATQTRNIEEIANVRVIDRTTLILDIFAQRARSKEGRLQVELAQQRYRLPRLAGMGVELSRLGAGIGTRGPGETKLETDKRHIRRRIKTLEDELEEIVKRRELIRQRRKKDNVTSVAIVGYTNVGKSTLLNALTDAGVLAENKLFATLDPTARALELPDGRSVLLIDTVGLIRRLPHHLVEAFKSTLEEASNADLILHVCDVSSDEVKSQVEVTENLLDELGCKGIPVVRALNKCDMISYGPDIQLDDRSVLISAKTGFGFDALLSTIAKTLAPTSKRQKLLLPFDKAGIIAKIRVEGKVFSEEYMENGILVDALVDHKLLSLTSEYES
ncbi:MAG: GTPase [Oscillospiraceae bacterium]|jgi:GTP-binding protein HflX|nr:GTPase [Oscillospiraceae bacterium]